MYEIYEDGRVFDLVKGKYLKPFFQNDYLVVRLKDSLGKPITKAVHRLVAEEFVENPNNYRYVIHIDGNPYNNHYTNLKWSELPSENFKNKKYSKIKMIDKKNIKEVEFNSLIEAALYLKSLDITSADLFTVRNNISRALNKNLTAYECYWIAL